MKFTCLLLIIAVASVCSTRNFTHENVDKEELERNIARLLKELQTEVKEGAIRSRQNQWDLFNPFYGHKCSRDLRMAATINDFKEDIRDSYNRCGVLLIISANEWKRLHGESFEELLRELHTCRGKHIARIQNRINDLFEEVHVCKINADSGILDNPVTPLRIHS